MSLPGIILAAGRSSRMGSDKALLPYGDSTFIGSLIAAFRQVFSPVIVVLGHHAERISPAIPSEPGIVVVVNEDYDVGMLSSLQTGLRALPDRSWGVVFTLVDHPGVRAETLRAIAEAMAESEPAVVIPRYRGERGHPVGVSRELIEELLALDPAASPQDAIRNRRDRTVFVDLDDPAVTADIDRPEEYAALRKP